MKNHLEIDKLLEKGTIDNELELERAFVLDRKLRLMSKEDDKFKVLRNHLRKLIVNYEEKKWSDESNIPEAQIAENEKAIEIVEKEQVFIVKRKEEIKNKLKEFGINQQELGMILGHKNKSYISELMNGIRPFSLKDLVIIHQLFGISFQNLIPTTISLKERLTMEASIIILNNKKLYNSFQKINAY